MLASLGHPSTFQWVSLLGSVTAWHSSSGRQPNFAALNRVHHLNSARWPSRWSLAHILVLLLLSFSFLITLILLSLLIFLLICFKSYLSNTLTSTYAYSLYTSLLNIIKTSASNGSGNTNLKSAFQWVLVSENKV